MYYAITHLTIYKYSDPINDSVMELRMQPRSDETQRCPRFDLHISPSTKVFNHRDYLGNSIHTFDIPAPHTKLAIKAEAVVEVKDKLNLPNALPMSSWDTIDTEAKHHNMYDMLLPGKFAHPTDLLQDFADEINWKRRTDPLNLLRELNSTIYQKFDYVQNVTRVDSPIDDALSARRGVCQDFSHIMLALVRQVGIPARYVSGYLYHQRDHDRSDVDASHAWVEAWLPDLGWIGFDPTNDLIVSDRHIRVSIANDFAAASPSRGVFKGAAETELDVRVKVEKLDELPFEEEELAPEIVLPHYQYYQDQQAQQQ